MAQQDDHTDMVPVCQMVSCVMRNGWDVFNDDSLTEAAVVDGPNMDDYYHRCRRMRRILLFPTLDPLRIFIGTCREKRN